MKSKTIVRCIDEDGYRQYVKRGAVYEVLRKLKGGMIMVKINGISLSLPERLFEEVMD